MTTAEELAAHWRSRLQEDYPNFASAKQEAIVQWLLGENSTRLNQLNAEQVAIVQQAMHYRYRILKQRYLQASPQQAYQNLIQRLGSLIVLRNRIRTWIALSRDRLRTVRDVLQEVLQGMMQSDQYLRQQAIWIAQCTSHSQLRNTLVLATLEEYCLRPIRNQPLLVYRFVNYLQRSQRAGMTHIPVGELIRLVSDEFATDEDESPISLLDTQAVAQHQEQQFQEEQQTLRLSVQQEFTTYLAEHVEPKPLAAQWLKLYLQGRSQEEIAQILNLPIKQIYRLREKVCYHAVRVFAFKIQPQLVEDWLGSSLKQNLGLTLEQWEQLQTQLTDIQCQVLEQLKAGNSSQEVAQQLGLRSNQISAEWCKIYQVAQTLRSNAPAKGE